MPEAAERTFGNKIAPLSVVLNYYRDIDRKEIDLLMISANCLYPIEIKKAKAPSDPDKNFSVLNQFGLEVKPGIILCMADTFFLLSWLDLLI